MVIIIYMKNKFKILTLTVILAFAAFFISSYKTKSLPIYKDCLTVHFINVQQGDSELIQINGKNLLIDAGSKEYRKDLLKYLSKCNIKKLDYIIATHPHEDHIGAMSDIIKNYDIGKFYSPKVLSNTKYFEKMIENLQKKNININILNCNTNSINLDPDVSVNIYASSKKHDDNLNNYSPIIKIQYKNTSFLFTGDAEKEIENEVLASNMDLKSDVLKVGHHGSSSSSGKNFISAVNPSYAIISCGKDNNYGHPHKITLKTLEELNIKIERTDIKGDIIFYSDGNRVILKE